MIVEGLCALAIFEKKDQTTSFSCLITFNKHRLFTVQTNLYSHRFLQNLKRKRLFVMQLETYYIQAIFSKSFESDCCAFSFKDMMIVVLRTFTHTHFHLKIKKPKRHLIYACTWTDINETGWNRWVNLNTSLHNSYLLKQCVSF